MNARHVLEILIELLFIAISVATPFLAVLAIRGRTKRAQQNLPRWRKVLGLISVLLTLVNWLAFVFALFAMRIGLQVGPYVDSYAAISVIIAILGAGLGCALRGTARIQAVVGGSLMATIWLIGILVGRN